MHIFLSSVSNMENQTIYLLYMEQNDVCPVTKIQNDATFLDHFNFL